MLALLPKGPGYSVCSANCVMCAGKIRRQAAGFKAMRATLQEKEQALMELMDAYKKTARQLEYRYGTYDTSGRGAVTIGV